MDEFKVRKAGLFERGTQNKSSEFRELRDNLEAAENNFKGATDRAAELRRELKNMGITSLPVLFSTEEPVRTGKRVPASISFVPSSAGLMMAGHVIRELIK